MTDRPSTRAIALARAGTPLIDPHARSAMAYQRKLEASQWHGAEQIQARQLGLLATMARHARTHVPHYRHQLRKLNLPDQGPITLEQWREIPILTRAQVQERPAALQAEAVPKNHGAVLEIKTSGSTGTPLAVHGTDYVNTLQKALGLRAFLWHGLEFSGTLAIIRWVENDTGGTTGTIHPRWTHPAEVPFITGPAHILGIAATVQQQAEWLAGLDPDYLQTFPSTLTGMLGEFRTAIRPPGNLKRIRTMGEVVSQDLRTATRDTFGFELQDVYSTQELGIIAIQCADHPVYHIQSEFVFVEILDADDRPVAPGETGRVIVTGLHNCAMPLLRYEQGDYAVAGAPCTCGRGLPVLTEIMGRHRNLFVRPDGSTFWPAIGARYMPAVAPVRQYRVIQASPSELTVEMIVARPLSDDEEGKIRKIIADTLPWPFDVTLRFVNDIPRGSGGKYEEFICTVETDRAV